MAGISKGVWWLGGGAAAVATAASILAGVESDKLSQVKKDLAALQAQYEACCNEVKGTLDNHEERLDELDQKTISLGQAIQEAACHCNDKKPAAPAKKNQTTTKKQDNKKSDDKPVKKDTVVDNGKCDGDAAIKVISGEDKVIIKETDDNKPDQIVVVTGDNNGTIIVNSEGIVKTTAEEAAKKAEETVYRARASWVKKERCY
ncbi:MAG: hypothetical protein J6W40_04415 [Alphaproteobacteria bacterium]|nr:hypothetical protein [Alphaproteobacteria bacterium]